MATKPIDAFAGACCDPISGGYLLGNGHRLYLPGLMRFSSMDAESPFHLGGVNPYVYCLGDPINRADPGGDFSFLGIIKDVVMFLAPKGHFDAAQFGVTAGIDTALFLAFAIGTGGWGLLLLAAGFVLSLASDVLGQIPGKTAAETGKWLGIASMVPDAVGAGTKFVEEVLVDGVKDAFSQGGKVTRALGKEEGLERAGRTAMKDTKSARPALEPPSLPRRAVGASIRLGTHIGLTAGLMIGGSVLLKKLFPMMPEVEADHAAVDTRESHALTRPHVYPQSVRYPGPATYPNAVSYPEPLSYPAAGKNFHRGAYPASYASLWK
ncbi:RHS repeat-associated core domain-containing protein [Trinickia sp.]|uniref:RHS repeat-associated core domain-containing protein n=1 Tax=Trinickia sp. TaxID=2571163 RepID=UPI003F822A1B